MASLPSGVMATACGGPCTVCSMPTSTVALTTGGKRDASSTTRLSRGAGSGKGGDAVDANELAVLRRDDEVGRVDGAGDESGDADGAAESPMRAISW